VAGSSLLALIDDIASILDDVAVMTKVAAKKTAGADRELPVVWAVAKGSSVNKLILVPAALAISLLAPWAITPLLMLGGAYLCFEGFEKLAHKFLHNKAEDEAHHAELVDALVNTDVDMVAFEKEKIKGAVRTDFILSAEIIVIALGTVKAASFTEQVAVLIGIAVIMTIGVYGLVAAIVKLDDAGLYLTKNQNDNLGAKIQRGIGNGLLVSAPWLMKSLAIIGTAAMFMVGGGILTHGIPAAHDVIHNVAHATANVPAIGGMLEAIVPTLLDAVAGIVAGGLVLVVVSLAQRMIGAFKKA
jgi:uncharacterized protein